jgi:hypothetical protein
LLYPRIVEDASKYNLILRGVRVASAKGSYLDISTKEGVVASAYDNIIATNDICIQYGTLEYTSGSQGEYFDNGTVAFKLTSCNPTNFGNNIRILSMPAGYPFITSISQEVAFYRPRPATQKNDQDLNFSKTFSNIDFSAQTINHAITNFCVVGVITGVSATAPTTGGTVDLKRNGTTFATLTWANNVVTSVGSGSFFTNETRGIVFDEGDVLSIVVNSGVVGGSIPKITLSTR